jgi:hypothetical protein
MTSAAIVTAARAQEKGNPTMSTIATTVKAVSAVMLAYSEDWDANCKTLLGENAKLTKLPNGAPVLAQGVSMAPGIHSIFANVCEFLTKGCFNSCVLHFAGRTTGAAVRAAARARTGLWHFMPDVFYRRLRAELVAFARRVAKLGVVGYIRLNTASDIDHGSELPNMFPSIVFYHYTKSIKRCIQYARGLRPANEHYSFSISERTTFDQVQQLAELRCNMILVVDAWYHAQYKCRTTGARGRYAPLPGAVTFKHADGRTITLPAVDGDVHDLRVPEFDGRGVVVCLRLKGSKAAKANARKTGFAVPWALGLEKITGELVRRGHLVVDMK